MSSVPEQVFLASPPAFQQKTFLTAFFITLNTNSAVTRLQKSDYANAFLYAIKKSVMFPTSLTVDPRDNQRVLPPTNYQQVSSLAEYNSWWATFNIAITNFGVPERGPRLQRHHMHVVVVIQHKNFMRLHRNTLREQIELFDDRIKYTNIEFIQEYGALAAMFYAVKNGAVTEIGQVIWDASPDRQTILYDLIAWRDEFAEKYPHLRGNITNNNNNNNNNNNVVNVDNDDDYGGGYDGGGGDGGVAQAPTRRSRRINDDLAMWQRPVRSRSAPARARAAPQVAVNRPVTRALAAKKVVAAAPAARGRPVTRALAAKKVVAAAPAARGRPRSRGRGGKRQ